MSQAINLGGALLYVFQDTNNQIVGEYSTSVNVVNIQTATLEVQGADTCSITVQGCVNDKEEDNITPLDDENCQWTPLANISVKDYEITETITSDGIYYISLSGIQRIRLSVGDTTKTARITLMRAE